MSKQAIYRSFTEWDKTTFPKQWERDRAKAVNTPEAIGKQIAEEIIEELKEELGNV